MISQLARLRSAEACAANRLRRWEGFIAEADAEWLRYSADPRFAFGLAIYVGEGNKAGRERVSVANCDPRVIRRALGFFREYLEVPASRLRAHVVLHVGGDCEQAERYWQAETGIAAEQFFRTSLATSRSSRRTKLVAQPNGTCHVTVYSTRLKQKVNRWMELALRGE